jgi:N-acetylneuraminic acid mutarotase
MVTTDGEWVYVLGGFLPPTEDPDERPPVSRALLAYDPATDTWLDAGEVPIGTHHAGFVRVGERLYLFGGYRDNTFEPIADVWIFDPASAAWEEGTPMPTPRGALAYTVLDGRIHAIGGTVADPEALDPEEHHPSEEDASVGTHEVYDPATDSWERRAPMPTPRNHHVAEAVQGRIYVTAGREGRNFTLTVTEVYDPDADSWTEAAPLPTGRSGVAGAVVEDRFYVFGGETFDPGAQRTFDEAERYDPGQDAWEALPPMPTARHGLGAAVVDGRIYVLSGGPDPGFAFGDANERLTP